MFCVLRNLKVYVVVSGAFHLLPTIFLVIKLIFVYSKEVRFRTSHEVISVSNGEFNSDIGGCI